MIGVAAHPDDLPVAREFFELFKTPWEPAVPGRTYSVVLSDGAPIDDLHADAYLLYGSHAHYAADGRRGIRQVNGITDVGWDHSSIPVYGRLALFDSDSGILTQGHRRVDYRDIDDRRRVHRVGYDLFAEVRHLLGPGQPPQRAATPTLDLHIGLVRHLLLDLGIAFVEIPPRPDEHDFVCCLTHDVDFFGIRRHTFDRSLLGFATRATAGTALDLLRGRRSVGEAARNFAAFLSLPLVFLRVLPDPWEPFRMYAAADRKHRSTFFLVPFKGKPGTAPSGSVQPRRGVRYQVSEIQNDARAAAAAGNELAVHGIDAWRDEAAGRAEAAELSAVTGRQPAGVRMHWLYFDERTPERLERAGFTYDSSYGYNDAVGYKAGTSQVFRPLRTRRLLELPMAIMDSAMFYAGRMDLTKTSAMELCGSIVRHARQHGGTVVINWHDRSLAPERLWGRAYDMLLDELEADGRAWFATAEQAVDWFRWRRSIRFCADESGNVKVESDALPAGLPAARVTINRAGPAGESTAENRRFDGELFLSVSPQ